MAGTLAMLAMITFGRAGFPLLQAKDSRYTEFSIMLPLLSLSLITINRKGSFFGALWICGLLVVGLFNDFNLNVYKGIMRSHQQGGRCMRELVIHPEKNPYGICPTIYPDNIREFVTTAKLLEASFYPQLYHGKY
jgi:hypothetical protein